MMISGARFIRHKQIISDLLDSFSAQFSSGEDCPVILLLDAKGRHKARNFVSRNEALRPGHKNIIHDYEEASSE